MRIIGVKRCLAVCLVCVLTVIAVGCNTRIIHGYPELRMKMDM